MLFQLIRDARAGEVSVEIYVLNYTAITEALVKQNVMTTFQRTLWILQGLSDDLRWKVRQRNGVEDVDGSHANDEGPRI